MILIAFGGNLSSSNREQAQRFSLARAALVAAGCRLICQSAIYSTAPVGSGRQNRYLNAVVAFDRGPPPAMLLRLLKRIERDQGRRFGRHWGPRVLDLDLIRHGTRVVGWPVKRRQRGTLLLPHPEYHRRGFVLVPMLDIERLTGRRLRHPVLGLQTGTLWKRAHTTSRGIERQHDVPEWTES